MNFLLVWALLIFPSALCMAQETTELYLSKEIKMDRLGVWENGNAKVYVPLDSIEKYIRETGFRYADKQDSVSMVTAQRYIAAADQLKNAEQGFDLKKIILYYGYDNNNMNVGNSVQLSHQIWHWLRKGCAAVYFKNKRVYNLKKAQTARGGFNAITYTVYYKKEKNIIWRHNSTWGW